MIRHPSAWSKFHVRSAATASAPYVKPSTISYLDRWKPHTASSTHEPLPESRHVPKPKVWSRPPQQPIPTSAETPIIIPHRETRAVPPPEALKKWSRPVVPPKSNLSEKPVLDPSPTFRPQNVSQPVNRASQRTTLSPDPNFANQSPPSPTASTYRASQRTTFSPHPNLANQSPSPTSSTYRASQRTTLSPHLANQSSSPTASTHRASQRTTFSPHPNLANQSPSPTASIWPQNAPQSINRASQCTPDSNLANQSPSPTASIWPQNVPQSINRPSQRSPDPNLANQSLREAPQIVNPEIPQESLDTDEFSDERLRSGARRRDNQKNYFEGRGRFERVPSKVLLQQSANTPLFKKKSSSAPKLIKARRMDVFIPSALSVAALAKLLNVKLARLQQKMRQAGMESESNYDYILTSDYAILLAEEFGRNPIVDDEAAFDLYPPVAHPNPSSLPSRPPIVTIMGHVDHGKTTLLDTLRSASVAKGEAGGITQHIGAFSVPVSKNGTGSGPQSITFLDTPGHAAFSAMRARGANVTDIIVLVVAADDGIMPQTKEVINLFKREDSQVSLVVAINKIDKPNVNLDSVKRALMVEGIQVEEFGGDIPAVHVSGLTGEGLPELLETLSLVAEMQDLRAEHTGPVHGYVLESNVQKGLGPVATILIRRGCLKVGTHVLSGISHAKVRRMNDSNGKVVPAALPGMAVTVSGWKILPKAGDDVLDGCENDIKKAISNRERRQEIESLHQDVEAINSRRQQHRDLRTSGDDEAPLEPVPSGPLELKLIIKADVSGSAEAIRDALHGIGNASANAQVIFTGVGEIMESDVMMAKSANATIIGFSVKASRSVQNNANQNGVPICTSDIIYRLVDDVRERVTGLLPIVVETKVTGEATILQLFDIKLKQKQTMKIAGCRVTNGIIEKQKFVRVVRNGNIVHDGTLSTMRQLKKDITEARKGTECGLGFGEFSDLEAGDLIQAYDRVERPGVL